MKQKVSPKKFSGMFPALPVVLVSCGVEEKNIITVAWITPLSFNPPLLGISIGKTRHSHKILKNSDCFAVNIPTKNLLEDVKFCGSKTGRDFDKFEVTNLTPRKCDKISTYFIEECPVNMECKIVDLIETGDHTWFVGEVVEIHIDDDYDRKQGLLYSEKIFYCLGEIVGRR